MCLDVGECVCVGVCVCLSLSWRGGGGGVISRVYKRLWFIRDGACINPQYCYPTVKKINAQVAAKLLYRKVDPVYPRTVHHKHQLIRQVIRTTPGILR